MNNLSKYPPLLIAGVACVALYVVGGLMKFIAPLVLLAGVGWWVWKVVQAQKPDGPLWKFWQQVKGATEFVWKPLVKKAQPPPKAKEPSAPSAGGEEKEKAANVR